MREGKKDRDRESETKVRGERWVREGEREKPEDRFGFTDRQSSFTSPDH